MMNTDEILYLIPYLFSLILTLGIFLYTWQHRSFRGAKLYSWFVAGQALTIFGYILEMISPSLETKIFWDKFQWLTDSFLIILPFWIFAVQFSEYELPRPRLTWGIWLGLPILFTILLLTDHLHHLIYPNPHLSQGYPFPELQYNFTFVIYIYTILYLYGANIYGISFLMRRAIRPYNAHRLQYWTIVLGIFIPMTLSILPLANIHLTPQRDIAPFTFAVGNLIVAWGLFRFGLFNLVPIARERVLENITDAVIVLDESTRIVDINRVALAYIGKQSNEVIGHPVQESFGEWSALFRQTSKTAETTFEVSAQVQGETKIFDLSISPIHDQRDHLIGRVIVAHDITRRKMLEDGYRQISEGLEQRVRERTEDLRKITERYRAVVENQTEFIVRWKLEGGRTFTNEAYRRYFDLTPEQAASSDFLQLVAEEDREAVVAKISRLVSGENRAMTDIHRVIKPDGSIGWQEWTDQAIYDENGQAIEFQSVGRDVTERVQAEEALREKQEELERFFTSTLDLFCIADTDGYFRRLNPEWEKVLGYRLEDLEGMRFLDLVHPDDQTATLAAMAKLDAQEIVINFTNRYLRKDGTYCWLEWRSISHGKIAYAAARDITERKQAEIDLRESEERFRKVFHSSPVAICVTTLEEGRLLDANRVFWEQTGFNPETAIGRDHLELDLWGGHPEHRAEFVANIRETHSVYNPNFIFSDTRGTKKYAIAFFELINIGEKPCILSMLLDVSAQKLADDRLRELTRRIVAAQEDERKHIAQELHDELGQALTAISLDLGSIERDLPPEVPPEIVARLVDARALADETDERISELALDLRPSLLDDLGLLPTLQWYLSRYEVRLGVGVAFDVKNMETRLPGEVETTLYRVIQEALTNIARHAQANSVRVSLERSADSVKVNIQDDGRGLDMSETKNETSLVAGVGLLGMKDRVATLGGSLEIHSRPGQGVLICITIPL